jgi:hypothetical protein
VDGDVLALAEDDGLWLPEGDVDADGDCEPLGESDALGLTLALLLALALELGDVDAEGLRLPEGETDGETLGLTLGLTDDEPAPPAVGLWSTMTHSAATRASPPGPTETRTPAVAASSVALVQALAVPGCW